MKLKFVCLIFFSLVSLSVFAQTDPCSTLADLTVKSNENVFVGYGSAASQKEADENSRIELARNIRQKVSSSATIEENNLSSQLNSSSKSMVSELLIGAKTIQRCQTGGRYSAVVTLEKSLFLSSLKEKLAIQIKKANDIKNSLQKSKSEHKGKLIEDAINFLETYEGLEKDYELCKIYKGCAGLDIGNIVNELKEIVAENADKNQYAFITNSDAVTEQFRENLISLLESEKIKIQDASSFKKDSPTRKVTANCKVKVGNKIPGSNDKVIEARCIVEVFDGKQKKMRKVYSCKAIGGDDFSNEDAIDSCVGRLQADN